MPCRVGGDGMRLLLPVPLSLHKVFKQLRDGSAPFEGDDVGPFTDLGVHGQIQFAAQVVFGFSLSHFRFVGDCVKFHTPLNKPDQPLFSKIKLFKKER